MIVLVLEGRIRFFGPEIFANLSVVCRKRLYLCDKFVQESFVAIFGLFQCVQLAQKICENDWTKLNASNQIKGRRVLKSAQI